jgi:hypothetical protein
MQPGDERGLGFDGEDARAEVFEEQGVVTNICPDIEDESIRADELAEKFAAIAMAADVAGIAHGAPESGVEEEFERGREAHGEGRLAGATTETLGEAGERARDHVIGEGAARAGGAQATATSRISDERTGFFDEFGGRAVGFDFGAEIVKGLEARGPFGEVTGAAHRSFEITEAGVGVGAMERAARRRVAVNAEANGAFAEDASVVVADGHGADVRGEIEGEGWWRQEPPGEFSTERARTMEAEEVPLVAQEPAG